MEIFDISSNVFKNDPPAEFPDGTASFLKSLEKGDECNMSFFSSSSHSGTHIVAPSFCCEDGETVDQLDLSPFIGPCKVLKLPEGPITGEYVENNFPRGKRRLLIKSSGTACFFDHAALCAVNLGIKLIGVDSPSVGVDRNKSRTYRAFFNNGISILEGLNLEDVPEGNYFLIALPIKSVGLEAAPARAILIKDEIKWTNR